MIVHSSSGLPQISSGEQQLQQHLWNKCWNILLLDMLEFCSPNPHLFDQKYCKNWIFFYRSKQRFSMWKYCEIKCIPVMCSCIFSIITPVFSVTWSSEIIIIYWFTAQEIFLIIINVVDYFCGNVTFYFIFHELKCSIYWNTIFYL